MYSYVILVYTTDTLFRVNLLRAIYTILIYFFFSRYGDKDFPVFLLIYVFFETLSVVCPCDINYGQTNNFIDRGITN